MNPIVLYFGSFNPLHQGHISVAKAALNYFKEQAQICFVLSAQNPFKSANILQAEEKRWKGLVQGLSDYPEFKACDIELKLPKPSYTIQTLEVLSEENKQADLYILMGEDNLQGFSKWKSYEKIISYCKLLVYPRKVGSTQEEAIKIAETEISKGSSKATIPNELQMYSNRIILLSGELFPISSTFLRK